jgi:hypothetical protein
VLLNSRLLSILYKVFGQIDRYPHWLKHPIIASLFSAYI